MELRRELQDERVPIEICAKNVKRDVLKITNYMMLPPFLFYVLTFVLIMFLQRVDVSLSSSAFIAQTIRSQKLSESQFLLTQSKEMWFRWMQGVVRSVDAEVKLQNSTVRGNGYASQIVALDMIMVRQIRAHVGDCGLRDVLDPVSKFRIGSRCPLYDPKAVTHPFGKEGNFLPNHLLVKNGTRITGISTTGYFHSLNNPDNEYPVVFYLLDDLEVNLEKLSEMQDNGFIDTLSRSVVVDVFSYFPDEAEYIVSSFIYEVSKSGYVHTSAAGHVMKGFQPTTTTKKFILFLDVILFIQTLGLFFILTAEVYQNRLLNGSWKKAISLWDIFTLVMACLMFAVSVRRFQLYDIEWRRSDPTNTYSFARRNVDTYIKAHELYVNSYDIMCFAFLFLGIKLFYYLQYIKGLNIITATLKECAEDLVALGIFAFILLSVYATAGVVVFGQVFEPMRTIWHAVSYLVRTAMSAELEGYEVFHRHNPLVTYVFFGSFFIFFWIMVLNLVIGVTSDAFRSSSSSTDHDNALEVFQVFFLLRGSLFEIDKHTQGQRERHDLSACELASSQALRMRAPFVKRYKFLHSLRRTRRDAHMVLLEELSLHREMSEATINRSRLVQILDFMDANSRDALFNEALVEAGRATQTRDTSEQKHQKLMGELVVISKAARDLVRNINEATGGRSRSESTNPLLTVPETPWPYYGNAADDQHSGTMVNDAYEPLLANELEQYPALPFADTTRIDSRPLAVEDAFGPVVHEESPAFEVPPARQESLPLPPLSQQEVAQLQQDLATLDQESDLRTLPPPRRRPEAVELNLL